LEKVLSVVEHVYVTYRDNSDVRLLPHLVATWNHGDGRCWPAFRFGRTRDYHLSHSCKVPVIIVTEQDTNASNTLSIIGYHRGGIHGDVPLDAAQFVADDVAPVDARRLHRPGNSNRSSITPERRNACLDVIRSVLNVER